MPLQRTLFRTVKRLVALLALLLILAGCSGSDKSRGPLQAGKKVQLIILNVYTYEALEKGQLKEIVLEKKVGKKIHLKEFEFHKGDQKIAAPAGFPANPYHEYEF